MIFLLRLTVVYLLIPTSNRNLWHYFVKCHFVVYLLIPTSNRNHERRFLCWNELYIFLFLHQTATCTRRFSPACCCISSYSYIKPQLLCFVSTFRSVVYLLIPTSNRNFWLHFDFHNALYIFLFLHQTATPPRRRLQAFCCISSYSYIKPQRSLGVRSRRTVVYLLIPTSNRNRSSVVGSNVKLYIFLFLHQTATIGLLVMSRPCCISSYSYIKPQLCTLSYEPLNVVYLLIPTSNRNTAPVAITDKKLYIFLFLHQTATVSQLANVYTRCISSYSYIKPQLFN